MNPREAPTPAARACVLDASALVAFLRDEPGAARVASLLSDARANGYQHRITAVNWAEVVYIATAREPETLSAPALVGLLDSLPVVVVPVDRELGLRAAYVKRQHGLALADAFAAALALDAGIPLLTADADFDPLAADGLAVERIR